MDDDYYWIEQPARTYIEVITDGNFIHPPGFYRLRERVRVPVITEPVFSNVQHTRCRITRVTIKT